MKFGIIPVILLLACALCSSASGGVPTIINYQGFLTDSLGDPVLNGEYEIIFSIYDDLSGGTLAWTSGPQPVQVVDGIFNYDLGAASPFPQDLFQTDTLRYLSLSVSGVELFPRTRFASVAYALKALQADTAAIALSVEDGVITSANIENGTIQLIDIGQNGATSGQIIKWNGSAWEISDDLSGGGGGWSDDGNVVRLETTLDSVGIGITTPAAKLDVGGTIRADVGYDNVNAIEGFVDSDMSAVYGVNAIGTEGALGSVDAGVWGAASGGLWAGQFYGNTYTSGSMAIGILSPASKFHMHGADPVLTIGTTTDFAGLRIRKYSADKWEFAWDDVHDYLYLKSFSPAGTVMVIDDLTGNVGFGTTSPIARVHGRHALGSYGLLGATNTGVLGYSPAAGYGVRGDTETGYGLYGSSSGAGYGVYGLSNGGRGVMGVSSAGPFGYIGSDDYGVYGDNPTAFAGYFNGSVRVTEKLGIGAPGTLTNILHIESNNPVPVINTTGSLAYWKYKVGGTTEWEVGYNGNDEEFFFKHATWVYPVLTLKDDGNVGIGVDGAISRLTVAGDIHLDNSTRGLNWPPGQTMPFGTWNGSTFTERMRIGSDGNLGIGTASPADKLHVAGNIRLEGSGAFLRFADAGAMKWSWLYKSWAGATFQLFDETIGNAIMAFEEGTRQVGINTTTPNATLDVNGDVNVTGNLTVTGSSPFPAPNYDSGWLTIGAGQEHLMTHSLGGDANKYVVDFQMWGPALETNSYRWGGDFHQETDGTGYLRGAYYKNLNTATVILKRAIDDTLTEKVRMRIWVYD